MRAWLRCLLPVLLLLPACVQAAALAPLSAAEIPALLKPPTHGERILAIWSLDCVYCEANLQALAKLQRAHPHEIALVTVATDDIAQRQAIERRLHAAGMDAYPARAYLDASPERLDYLLDPDWGGETPHTLVIRADGTRRGISGLLTPSQLRQLL